MAQDQVIANLARNKKKMGQFAVMGAGMDQLVAHEKDWMRTASREEMEEALVLIRQIDKHLDKRVARLAMITLMRIADDIYHETDAEKGTGNDEARNT